MNARTLPVELTPGFIERTLVALNNSAADLKADNDAAEKAKAKRSFWAVQYFRANSNEWFTDPKECRTENEAWQHLRAVDFIYRNTRVVKMEVW